MTKIKILLSVLAMLVVTAAFAQDRGYYGFATPGTALNLGTNYVILPANSVNGSEPIVTYINYTTFAASGSYITNYYSMTNSFCTAVQNAGTTNFVFATNGFAAGQWVVITHLAMPPRVRNEAALIVTVQNTNQVITATASTTATAVGDVLYAMLPGPVIPVSQLTTGPTVASINGTGIITGQRERPWLMVVSSTGVGTNYFNTVNAIYQGP